METKRIRQIDDENIARAVLDKNPGIELRMDDFLRACIREKEQREVDNFEAYCQEAASENFRAFEMNRIYGKKGKYTETYGWSEDGTFRFDYIIPNNIYWFMINLVYKDFWSDSNSKVWRRFMKRICEGDDPYQALMEAKSIFGKRMGQGFEKKESVEIYGPNN